MDAAGLKLGYVSAVLLFFVNLYIATAILVNQASATLPGKTTNILQERVSTLWTVLKSEPSSCITITRPATQSLLLVFFKIQLKKSSTLQQ